MSNMDESGDHMPFMSAEDIRAIIWFTRIFPLLVLTVVSVAYAVTAHEPGWLPASLGL